MLTIEERTHMYQGKKTFINHISKVFEDRRLCSNVLKVDYEVYFRQIDEETTYYTEFAVVTFEGGGKSVRVISGNSNNTNFQEIGKLINGGYYDDLEYYEQVKACSTEMELEELQK